jgi:hypothetical protein
VRWPRAERSVRRESCQHMTIPPPHEALPKINVPRFPWDARAVSAPEKAQAIEALGGAPVEGGSGQDDAAARRRRDTSVAPPDSVSGSMLLVRLP